MSPWEAVGACIATAIGLYLIGSWLLDRSIRARREEDLEIDRWQRTARNAARRNETKVRSDLAKARAALDLTTCQAIWNITQHDVPHQTRRTEEDQ